MSTAKKPKLVGNAPGGKAPTKTAAKSKRLPWRTSEFVANIFAYLSNREKALMLGGGGDSKPVADIIDAILTANKLPMTRGTFPKIVIPAKVDAMTNVEIRKDGAWTPSELLYAVFGYLSTRKAPLIFSAFHDPSPIVEIIGDILKENFIPGPGDRYPKIKVPEGLDNLTNAENLAPVDTQAGNGILKDCTASTAPAKSRDPLNDILNILGQFKPGEQNAIFGAVARELLSARHASIKYYDENLGQLHEQKQQAEGNKDDLLLNLKQIL